MLTDKTKTILKDIYILRNKRVYELEQGLYPINKVEISRKHNVTKQYVYHLDGTFTQRDIRNILSKDELDSAI